MRKSILLFALAVIVFACQPSSKESTRNGSSYQTPKHHIPELTKVFDAHGGYEKWAQMKSLSYQKGEESTVTNLHNRKIRVQSPTQTIGFDGTQVWMTPDTADAGRARFYHNLYFYFFAMPFVVGDPGANYEEVGKKELAGKWYEGIKVSYGENVGDAPDDNYILWVNPHTNRMEWLMYTVTYRSGEPSENYSLIKYEGWNDLNGLILPSTLQWYKYEGDTIGDPRGQPAIFERVEISDDYPSDSLFAMPVDAQIAPF